MFALPYALADDALASRHQNVVCLGELRFPQSVKRIVEMDV
jgi:hypothetical protein